MVLLISIPTLKEEYLIDENLDDKFVISNIKKAQDFIVREVLGEDKYNQLISDVENQSVSDEDDEFIKEYIQPVIAYYVMSEVVYSTAYKFKNKPEDVVQFDDLIKISNKYRNDCDKYQQILKEYMCDNAIMIENANTYKTGIFLGNGRFPNYDERP